MPFPNPQILTGDLFFLLISTFLLQLDKIIRLICLKIRRQNDLSVCRGSGFLCIGRPSGSQKRVLVPSPSIKYVRRLSNSVICTFLSTALIFHSVFSASIFSLILQRKKQFAFLEKFVEIFVNRFPKHPPHYTYSVFEDFCLKVASHIFYPWLPTPNF
jgi:hypothetical protein